MSFKRGGHIEHWLLQYLSIKELQNNQQPAAPAVAVQKRVNGFKLIMRNRDFD